MCPPQAFSIMTDAFLLGLLVFSASVAVLLEPLLATRNFEIRWRDINCTAIDLATTAAFHCMIVELPKRQGNFLNTRLLFNRPVPKMWVELSVGQISGSGSSKDRPIPNLLKVRVDACQLSGFRSKNRILNAVLGKLLQSGNYPKNCPLLGNVNYTSTHFALNPDHFPAYMPDMKFNTKLVFYQSKNITLIRASVDAEVVRRS